MPARALAAVASSPAVIALALAAGVAAGVRAQPSLTPGAAARLVAREDAGYRADLRRAIGAPDPAVRAIAARVAGVRHQGDMIDALRAALASETDAIATREQQRAISRLQNTAAVQPPAAAPAAPLVRTFPAIVPGLLPSLMQETGCTSARDGSFGAARIVFDASGAVTRSDVDPSQLPSKCREVLSVMARLAVADEGPASSSVHAEWFLLPLDAGFVNCVAEPGPPENGSGPPTRGPITPPVKTRDVRPEYPRGALRARAQGIVFVAAHLTASGCVDHARVTQGVHPEFDFAALRAIVAWRFEPARVEGRPVPFLLKATVSFNIR